MEVIFQYRHLFSCIHVDMNVSVMLLVWIFSKKSIPFEAVTATAEIYPHKISFVFGVHIAGLQGSRVVTEKAYSYLKSSSLFEQCQFLKNS